MKDIFESEFVFNFTEANVVALLDNTNSSLVSDLWQLSKSHANVGRVEEAKNELKNGLPGGLSAEARFLRNFLTSALSAGQHERVGVFGLSKSDILQYFPAEDFDLAISWGAANRAYVESASKDNFKEWLSKVHGANFSSGRVAEAAISLAEVPSDFQALLIMLESNQV